MPTYTTIFTMMSNIVIKTVGSFVIVSFLYIQRLIIGILYPLKKYVLL